MWSVYAIMSDVDNRIYIGMSSDGDDRVALHNKKELGQQKHMFPGNLFLWTKFVIKSMRKKEKNS
ncbi:MAG: GIY-YIG nuclease family protein [Flavobacteriales bacterium]|nr:GIY-YIG nuclease family protein [Flavobacteriales bacterium]